VIIDTSLWRSQIEISGICNLKCASCPYSQRNKNLNSFMEMSLFCKIIDDLKKIKKKSGFVISLNQFGEETLHPQYLKFLDIISDNKFKLLVSSNSTKFNENISRKFIEMGKDNLIDKLQLSLYGVDEESYAKQTGVHLFHRAYENIRKFVDLYDISNSTFDVELKIIVTKTNSTLISKDKFTKLFNLTEGSNMRIRYRKAFNWLGTVDENKTVFPLYCNKIASEMAIFSNGDVSYCCFNCFHHPILGNVKDNTLEEIWNGKAAMKYRSLWFDGCKKDVPLCNTCDRKGPHPKKDQLVKLEGN